MKAKIKEALVNKYKNLGIDDKVFDGVADIISQTVTDEAGIEAGIASYEGLLKTFQGATDRLRGEVASLKKQLGSNVEPDPKPEPPKQDSELAAILQKMNERMEAQEREINSFKAARSRETALSTAKSKLAEKGITIGDDKVSKKAWDIAMAGLTEEASVEDVVTRVTQEYNDLKAISGTSGYPPMEGFGGSEDKASERFAAMKERMHKQGII